MNRYTKYIIYILVLVLGIWYLYINRELISYLDNLNIFSIILVISVVMLSHLINAYKFKYLISIFSVKLKFTEWFGLTISNTMVNYYMPFRSGMILRAYYLKQKHNFKYSKYVSLISGSYILNMLISAFMLFITSVFLYFNNDLFNVKILYVSLLFIVLLCTILIIIKSLNIDKTPSDSKIFISLKRMIWGLRNFVVKPEKLIEFTFIQILFIVSLSLRLYVIYGVLDIPTVFSKLILVNCLVSFSMVISITPGNIGIKEGIIGISSKMLGLTPEEAVLGAVIDRVVVMILVFIFGMIFSSLLLKDVGYEDCR